MKSLKLKLVTAASLLVTAFAVNADAYSNVYVFGDSLSDNGNLNLLTGAPTPTRFTNGPVAVEVVAGGLGLGQLLPSNHLNGVIEGNNFAYAGAKAVDSDDIDENITRHWHRFGTQGPCLF